MQTSVLVNKTTFTLEILSTYVFRCVIALIFITDSFDTRPFRSRKVKLLAIFLSVIVDRDILIVSIVTMVTLAKLEYVELGIRSTTLIETVVYLPRKSYFLQHFGANRRAAPEASMHGPLFAESFSIITHVCATFEVGRELLMRENHVNPKSLLRARGIIWGWERGTTIARCALIDFYVFIDLHLNARANSISWYLFVRGHFSLK